MYYYHHSLLGVGVRGQPHLWWVLDMGLTRSAERGRVPPEDKDVWKRVMDIIFEKDDNLIQMSDSAAAFLQDHFGVLQRFSVNHSEKEWTKHVRPIWNVETAERRASLCSTNYADSQWQKMKDAIPNGIKSSTAGSRRMKMLYVRAWQWKVIVQQEDRWDAFCAACKRWREHQRCTPPEEAPADAGHFGFDETGEAALLRKEEGLRKKWRDERSKGVPVADVPQVTFNDWAGEDSDATDSSDSDGMKEGEGAVNDSSSDAPEAQTVSPRGEKDDDDLQVLSRTQYGDRYFEPQLELQAHCGLHAVKNLLGGPQFSVLDLRQACHLVVGELAAESSYWEDGGLHALPNGWYSHGVLAKAFDLLVPPTWKMLSSVARGSDWGRFADPAVAGCLVNLRNTHWASIAAHEGNVFYLDSQHLPVLIEEQDYDAIITQHRMSFFVVAHDSDFEWRAG